MCTTYIYIHTLYALDSTYTRTLDSSHCLHCSSNCSGRGIFISFTTCTTVCQVRGSSPVPSLLRTQSSTSCNIQSSTSDLSFSILSMMSGSIYKNVPNFLHLASSFPSRALITSTWHMKIEIALHRQGECHTCSTELSMNKVDLATEYSEWIISQPQNLSH